MTITANMHSAKTHFSNLIQSVLKGDEVIIAKSGKPIACIVPYHERHPTERTPGSARGKLRMADDFDAPLSETELRAWES
jgi:prevent-host-death family protein